MGSHKKTSGSVEEFDESWKKRRESLYNHWTPGPPRNQVQFAFRQHWRFFESLMGHRAPGRSLEVGCGRGTLSSHFAQAGWETTLLDSSPAVLGVAGRAFEANGHHGSFVAGDANDLPFSDGSFDAVASIGLLEHFERVDRPISEQWRVLKPGGWFLGYIVPERPDNIQKRFNWLNSILKHTVGRALEHKGEQVSKEDIYRSDYSSEVYARSLSECGAPEVFVSGMYPLPLVSHSPQFPFSLLPGPMELALVQVFGAVVRVREATTGKNGWLCSEAMGQAFLAAAQKG